MTQFASWNFKIALNPTILKIDIALREQGTETVRCPCCQMNHHSTDDEGTGIVIGGRFFVPNYTVVEHKRGDRTNELTIPDNF